MNQLHRQRRRRARAHLVLGQRVVPLRAAAPPFALVYTFTYRFSRASATRGACCTRHTRARIAVHLPAELGIGSDLLPPPPSLPPPSPTAIAIATAVTIATAVARSHIAFADPPPRSSRVCTHSRRSAASRGNLQVAHLHPIQRDSQRLVHDPCVRRDGALRAPEPRAGTLEHALLLQPGHGAAVGVAASRLRGGGHRRADRSTRRRRGHGGGLQPR